MDSSGTPALPIAVIIDDDGDVRHLLKAVLTQSGFETVLTANASDGVEAVREFEPVVTLLDVSMPGMDGFAAARRIREFSGTYIMMLTALADEIDVIQGLGAGADDYLLKPVRPRELRARIETLLRRPRSRWEDAQLEAPAYDVPYSTSEDLWTAGGTNKPRGTTLTGAQAPAPAPAAAPAPAQAPVQAPAAAAPAPAPVAPVAAPAPVAPAAVAPAAAAPEAVAPAPVAPAPVAAPVAAPYPAPAPAPMPVGGAAPDAAAAPADPGPDYVELPVVRDLKQAQRVDEWVSHSGLSLNTATGELVVDGRPTVLNPSEFALLATLIESGRRVRSTANLVLTLRGESYVTTYYVNDGDKRAVKAHMTSLRRKIGDTGLTPRWIESVRGVGYRMTSD